MNEGFRFGGVGGRFTRGDDFHGFAIRVLDHFLHGDYKAGVSKSDRLVHSESVRRESEMNASIHHAIAAVVRTGVRIGPRAGFINEASGGASACRMFIVQSE